MNDITSGLKIMEDLFKMFVADHCSAEQVERFFASVALPENEKVIRNLINKSLSDYEATTVDEITRTPPAAILHKLMRCIASREIDNI